MSAVTKVLLDDHARVKRMFKQSNDDPSVVEAICDELIIHTTIEEEIVYPALRDEVDANLAAEAEAEHDEAKELIAAIRETEPEDTARLRRLVDNLEAAVKRHVDHAEREVFPQLESRLRADLYEMGREAFARRQELMEERDVARASLKPQTANLGWGGRRQGSANTGWG